jgi:hypothetical protein
MNTLETDKNYLDPEVINALREKFISEYASAKGWSRGNLSSEQMLEIASKPEYKTPGMLKS